MSNLAPLSDAEFEAALQQFVGREVGPARPAPDDVNLPMVRHWCEAIGDENPVYLDPVAAGASIHGQLVAPPTMLQAWVMNGLRGPQRDTDSPYEQMNQLLFSRGFTSVVATDSEQTYHRYLHPGDRLSMRTVIESISPQKTTALGTGHFITTRQDYYDAAGELVGSMLFRIIRFRSAAKPSVTAQPSAAAQPSVTAACVATTATARARPPRPAPATTLDNQWWFDALQAGELRVQRCAVCARLRHPAGPMCPSCHSLTWDSVPAALTGTVHSFVVVHYPEVASFDYPLPVVLVDLDGMPAIRVIMNTADCPIESLRVGARVRIEIRNATEANEASDASDATGSAVADGLRLPFAVVEPV